MGKDSFPVGDFGVRASRLVTEKKLGMKSLRYDWFFKIIR